MAINDAFSVRQLLNLWIEFSMIVTVKKLSYSVASVFNKLAENVDDKLC